jgi:hypothetical protein
MYCVINGNENCRNYTTENAQRTAFSMEWCYWEAINCWDGQEIFRLIIVTFARARQWTPFTLNSTLPTTSWSGKYVTVYCGITSSKWANVITLRVSYFQRNMQKISGRWIFVRQRVHGFKRFFGIQRAACFIPASIITAVCSHPAYCTAVYREWRYQMLW